MSPTTARHDTRRLRDGLRDDPTGLAPLIRRIEEWVKVTRCFPGLEKDRESVEALLRQVQARQASLEMPLRILLLGGTGVGKSTVFNALAGADLARATSTRPTTRELTAYYHEANGSAALGALEAQAKLVAHRRPLLRDKIVIDAPDFDSTAEENRALLERALEATDLAVCVVTSEKYLSAELFELIERYREGIELVFVLNKVDTVDEGELLAQDLGAELESHGVFGARILRVSALSVREAQRAAEEEGLPALDGLALPAPAGQWEDLRNLLERELDRVRIREIKAAKLGDRVRGVISRVRSRVPEDVPDKVTAWRGAWSGALRDLTADLSRSFFGAIHDDFELRNILRYLFGTAFAGVFGVFMTLVYGLRSILMPGYVRARRFSALDLEQLIGERLRAVEIAHVERRVEVVLERFEHEGRRLGFEPGEAAPGADTVQHAMASVHAARAGLPEGVAALVAAVRTRAARRFYEIFEQTAGGGRAGSQIGRVGWNVLPVVVVLLTIYAFLGSLDPSAGAATLAESIKGTIPLLEGGLVSLLVACLLQWPIAERVVQRRVLTSLALLENVVEQAVEECLGSALVREPMRVLEQILERHRELGRLCDDARRVLRDEDEGKPDAPERGREPAEAPRVAAASGTARVELAHDPSAPPPPSEGEERGGERRRVTE